jgi:hypothetical protein
MDTIAGMTLVIAGRAEFERCAEMAGKQLDFQWVSTYPA